MMTHRRFFVAACFWGAVLMASSFSLSANAGKSAPANGHMIVLNGATFFRAPVTKFPAPSSEFKSRPTVKMWMIRKETVETKGKYKDGKMLAEVKTISTAKLKGANKPGDDDCGITETWLAGSSREAQDDSLSAKTQNAKSSSYWNSKGFEIPDGFELVETLTETKTADSLLPELVNKAGGEKWMAAEFKKGEARYFIVPESTDDEFRSFFSVYLKTSPKAGLELIKRFDFVEACP